MEQMPTETKVSRSPSVNSATAFAADDTSSAETRPALEKRFSSQSFRGRIIEQANHKNERLSQYLEVQLPNLHSSNEFAALEPTADASDAAATGISGYSQNGDVAQVQVAKLKLPNAMGEHIHHDKSPLPRGVLRSQSSGIVPAVSNANVASGSCERSSKSGDDIDDKGPGCGGDGEELKYDTGERKTDATVHVESSTSISSMDLSGSVLTHPNGRSMFPTLSAAEQQDLSRDALSQAEASIVAESFVPDYDNVSDGGYDSDGASSASTSAESSIRDYMFENGRRYHKFHEGSYNFPNDDVEQEREDMKHAMIKLLCNQKLHFAPIGSNPQEILDLGTGTGIWPIEMGDMYPSAQVLGIDLSPIQPEWLPPNVRFRIDDVESPWLHPRNHFDYIHSRHTVMAIKDWMRLLRRSFEHLKPGGWMELQEIHHKPKTGLVDGVMPQDHPVALFWNYIAEGLSALGVNLNASADGQLTRLLEEAGFVNITERVFHVPIGTWPKNRILKTVGLYWRTILLDGLQAIALGPLTRGLRWNREEVEVFLMDVRRAYYDNHVLMYTPLHIVYGQRPA